MDAGTPDVVGKNETVSITNQPTNEDEGDGEKVSEKRTCCLKSEISKIFSMVNYNYFIDDISGDDQNFDENQSKIYLIYRLNNMLILPEPVALVRCGLKNLEKSSNEESIIDREELANLVVLPLNRLNRQMMSDFRRLPNIPKFRLIAGGSDSRITVPNKFQISNEQINTFFYTDQIEIHTKQFQFEEKKICINGEARKTNSIEILSGTMIFSVNYDGSAFRLNNCPGEDYFRLKIQINNNVMLHMENSISKQKLSGSIKNTMVRITDLKRMISESNYKNDDNDNDDSSSIHKSEKNVSVDLNKSVDSNHHHRSGTPPTNVPDSEIQKVRQQILSKTRDRLEENLAKFPPSPPPPRKIENKILELEKTKIISEKKNEEEKIDTKKITLPESAPSETNRTENIDHLLKSQPDVIIVNKINLNKLNKTPTVISWNHHHRQANRHSLRSVLATPDITRSKAMEYSLQSLSSSITNLNAKINKIDPKETSTIGTDQSYRTFRKMAIHDIQKSIQHLKYLNSFVMKNKERISQSIIDTNDDIRSKFDSYRKKLQEQLLRTIDSIERYVRYIHEETKTETTVDQENEDQIFFYNTIEKLMKLIMVMEPDVFRMISVEITECLIGISNKFFVSNS